MIYLLVFCLGVLAGAKIGMLRSRNTNTSAQIQAELDRALVKELSAKVLYCNMHHQEAA